MSNEVTSGAWGISIICTRSSIGFPNNNIITNCEECLNSRNSTTEISLLAGHYKLLHVVTVTKVSRSSIGFPNNNIITGIQAYLG